MSSVCHIFDAWNAALHLARQHSKPYCYCCCPCCSCCLGVNCPKPPCNSRFVMLTTLQSPEIGCPRHGRAGSPIVSERSFLRACAREMPWFRASMTHTAGRMLLSCPVVSAWAKQAAEHRAIARGLAGAVLLAARLLQSFVGHIDTHWVTQPIFSSQSSVIKSLVYHVSAHCACSCRWCQACTEP